MTERNCYRQVIESGSRFVYLVMLLMSLAVRGEAANCTNYPFKIAEFDIIFGQGISSEGSVLDLAVEFGIIVRSGAWYAYKDAKIGQGRDNTRDYLKANPLVSKEVEAQVRAKMAEKLNSGNGDSTPDFIPDDDDDIPPEE